MKITIYHGSKDLIENPQYGFGKKNNDYGLGFYCTENLDMAKEWAVDSELDGLANSYSFNLDGLSILDLNSDDYSILEWLVILIKNRRFDIQTDFGKEAIEYLDKYYSLDYSSYDVIKGYRADDSYFSFAQDFINNIISFNTLRNAMMLGRMGEQIVLKSPKAFEQLEFNEGIYVDSKTWFPKKEVRDKKVRNDYYELKQKPWKKGEIYMMQILDMEIKKDDARLR